MSFYFLPTDLIFFILILFFLFMGLQIYRQEPLKIAWGYLWSKPLAVCSLVILIFYMGIAFLDCLHFRDPQHPSQLQSVLDLVIKPAGQNDEKTYSAPFSKVSFSQETVTTGSENIPVRIYPKLQHVMQTSIGFLFILSFFIIGFLYAILITGCIVILFGIIRGCIQKKWNFSFYIQNNSFFVFFSSIFFLFFIAFSLRSMLPYFHILGTDKVGQDIFYEAIKSIRTGILIGSITTLMMLPLAIILGTAAGYFGGFIDDVIQYIYTTLSSIPGVLLIAASVLSLQIFIESHEQWFHSVALRADIRLLALCIILGITSWTGLCRLLRAETLKLRELDYIQAAKALGVSHFRILLRHIIPNVFHVVLITLVLDFSGLVLAEAVLSYVGVGVDPSMMSWGNMINSARLELSRDPMVWWPLTAAFIFMFILVLAANIFGDAVQEAFDPRVRSL